MLDMLSLANHLHQNTQNPTSKNSQTKKHDTVHAWAPTSPEGICSKGSARWLASSFHVHSNQTTTESFQVVELSWSNNRVTVTKLHVAKSAHIMFDALTHPVAPSVFPPSCGDGGPWLSRGIAWISWLAHWRSLCPRPV